MNRKKNPYDKTISKRYYLYASDVAKLEHLAETANVSQSQLIRSLIQEKKIYSHKDVKALIELNVEISRIGNNINQIARCANQMQINEDDIRLVLVYLHSIQQLLLEVQKAWQS